MRRHRAMVGGRRGKTRSGFKSEAWNARNKTENQSADDHDDRVWRSESLGEKSENNDK